MQVGCYQVYKNVLIGCVKGNEKENGAVERFQHSRLIAEQHGIPPIMYVLAACCKRELKDTICAQPIHVHYSSGFYYPACSGSSNWKGETE